LVIETSLDKMSIAYPYIRTIRLHETRRFLRYILLFYSNNIRLIRYYIGGFYSITDLERPFGFQEFEVPRISRHSARRGCKVVSPKHKQPLPPTRYPW